MPYVEKEPQKLFYTMGEVSAMLNVNTSLIRFWEKEFDVLKPKKNKKGNRLFTPEDVKNLKSIYHLVKEKGFTLEGAKKELEQKDSNYTLHIEVKEKLLSLRRFLTDLRDHL